MGALDLVISIERSSAAARVHISTHTEFTPHILTSGHACIRPLRSYVVTAVVTYRGAGL